MKLSLAAFSLVMTLAPFTGALAQSTEANCTSVDVRDFNPALREHYAEPRDQGRTGWCYGFAAADLITAETGKKVSAAHVSVLYNKHIADNVIYRAGYNISNLFKRTDLDDVYEGGYIRTATKKTVSAGKICTEQGLPFDSNIKLVEELDSLENMIKRSENKDSNNVLWIKEISRLMKSNNLTHIKAEILLQDLRTKNLNVIVESLLSEKCKDTIDVPSMKIKTVLRYANPRNFFMNNLNNILDTGKPIGIEYQVSHVMDMKGNHASVLTGRRWNNGTCEYKVRNSWGQTCSGYNSDITCNYKEGSFWVPEEKFYKMLHSFNYIK